MAWRPTSVSILILALMGAGGPGCARIPHRVEPEPASPLPRLFVEGHLRPTTQELFGALRGLGVELWIGPDRRLSLRVHEAGSFDQVCELLTELHHDIEAMDLAFVALESLEGLVDLRSIEGLDLSGARAELAPLRHLGQLRSLVLNATDYGSLAPLRELDRLERLELASARANLVGIDQLHALRELDLTHARSLPQGLPLREGEGLDLARLYGLSELEVLSLGHTKVQAWDPLVVLWTLRRLDLSYTNFQDLRLLADFMELETLSLRRTAVADLSPLVGLSALRHVDLRECELVDDSQIQSLRQARPGLEIQL